MARKKQTTSPSDKYGIEAHIATYEGFLAGSIGVTLICCYVLVALVTFRFIEHPLNMVVGFGGIIIGCIATVLGMRLGQKWLIPIAVLVLYGLFVAANVQMS